MWGGIVHLDNLKIAIVQIVQNRGLRFTNKDCKGIHEGRTGKCCTNAGYLECGKCTDAANCMDVHIWDTAKWGDRNEAVSKWNNRLNKAPGERTKIEDIQTGGGD